MVFAHIFHVLNKNEKGASHPNGNLLHFKTSYRAIHITNRTILIPYNVHVYGYLLPYYVVPVFLYICDIILSFKVISCPERMDRHESAMTYMIKNYSIALI
jgi:hypothetical protein